MRNFKTIPVDIPAFVLLTFTKIISSKK